MPTNLKIKREILEPDPLKFAARAGVSLAELSYLEDDAIGTDRTEQNVFTTIEAMQGHLLSNSEKRRLLQPSRSTELTEAEQEAVVSMLRDTRKLQGKMETLQSSIQSSKRSLDVTSEFDTLFKAIETTATTPAVYDHIVTMKSFARKVLTTTQAKSNDLHDTANALGAVAGGIGVPKSGRTISAATAQSIQDKADTLHKHADTMMDIAKKHVASLMTEADDLANTMQGAEPTYADDPGTPDPGQQEGGKRMLGTPTRHYNTKHFSNAVSTSQRILEIKSMAPSPQEQYDFQREYERVLQTKGESQAENFVGWYHARLLKGVYGF
jgi:hypothetical protein